MIRGLTIVALVFGTFASSPRPALGAAPAAPAEASEPSERPVVRLVIDTSGMFEDQREDTARWIREDGLPVLADAGVIVDDKNAELEVRVAIKVEGVGYTVETSVWKPGADKPEVDRGIRTCEACVRSEVLRLVMRELAWVGGWLTVRPAPATQDTPPPQVQQPEDEPVLPETAGAAEPQDEPGQKPSSKVLRNAGLALVVPGGVALGVGIGLIAAGKREVENPNGGDAVLAERNYRPTGIALAVSGGVVAAAGVALLVVHARRQRPGKGSRVAWSPVVDGSQAGFVLAGRF